MIYIFIIITRKLKKKKNDIFNKNRIFIYSINIIFNNKNVIIIIKINRDNDKIIIYIYYIEKFNIKIRDFI